MTTPSAPSHPAIQAWLSSFLATHEAVAGTVHVLGEGDVLELRAAVNIPPPVLALTQRVPRGKGMAGLALEREEPVSTCNLKTDETGDVRPGAKAVDAKAAVALPVRGEHGIVAVVGLAWMDGRDISPQQLEALGEAATDLPAT